MSCISLLSSGTCHQLLIMFGNNLEMSSGAKSCLCLEALDSAVPGTEMLLEPGERTAAQKGKKRTVFLFF